MSQELAAVVYGLASGFSWGAGDFSGGFVSRKAKVVSVLFVSQLIGAGLLILLGFLAGESAPPVENVIWSVLLGIVGLLGAVALYRGLSEGTMGIVAPVSALVTGGVPVIFSFFTEGLPTLTQGLGLAVAPFAIWLLSSADGEISLRWNDIRYGLLAGLGFGFGFILVAQMDDQSTFYSLLFSRVSSVILLVGFMLVTSQQELPGIRHLPLIALMSFFNVGGVSLFALATQNGRLDISSVLASLYPAVTVLLAWVILHERLNSRQWIGVVAALTAIALIAG